MRYDSYTRLINGKHPLPEGYIPKQLTDIGLPFQASSQDSRRLLEIRTARGLHFACFKVPKEMG